MYTINPTQPPKFHDKLFVTGWCDFWPRRGRGMTDFKTTRDQDRGKGAVEQNEREQPGNTSLPGQLGHRDQDSMLKSSDTDFPEPGENPEHSGEEEEETSKK
jgi:hypothetical protein